MHRVLAITLQLDICCTDVYFHYEWPPLQTFYSCHKSPNRISRPLGRLLSHFRVDLRKIETALGFVPSWFFFSILLISFLLLDIFLREGLWFLLLLPLNSMSTMPMSLGVVKKVALLLHFLSSIYGTVVVVENEEQECLGVTWRLCLPTVMWSSS